MRRAFLYKSLAGSILLWSTGCRPTTNESQTAEAYGAEEYLLSNSELKVQTNLAERGRSDSAYNLAKHYESKLEISLSSVDKKTYIFWLEKAASLNNSIAIADRIHVYLSEGRCKSAEDFLNDHLATVKFQHADLTSKIADCRRRPFGVGDWSTRIIEK